MVLQVSSWNDDSIIAGRIAIGNWARVEGWNRDGNGCCSMQALAVIDTSVLTRYLIRPSATIKELVEELWLGEEVQMVTAPELIEELEGVLERDYIQALIRPAEGKVLLDAIYQKAESLPSFGEVPSFTRDPKDDKFVACALVGSADCLVTVDEDILILDAVGDVRMVIPTILAGTIP
jgi:putative PIN family toxin of toxin-antitoxin system